MNKEKAIDILTRYRECYKRIKHCAGICLSCKYDVEESDVNKAIGVALKEIKKC